MSLSRLCHANIAGKSYRIIRTSSDLHFSEQAPGQLASATETDLCLEYARTCGKEKDEVVWLTLMTETTTQQRVGQGRSGMSDLIKHSQQR